MSLAALRVLALALILSSAGIALADDPVLKDERISIAVTEFVSKGGVDQQRMEALSDMLANQIREMGPFKVIGKADIVAALQLEEQKSMLGCSDDSCLAEIGGALGVRYMVVGNISQFGETWLLNLKLLDVKKVEVVKGVSRSITGAEDIFIAALPKAAHELLGAIEGVELKDAVGVEKIDGEVERRKSGWFVAPGGRGGDFVIALGVGLLTAPPAYVRGSSEEEEAAFAALEEELYNAAWLNLYLGYNPVSWLTIAARVGGTLGKAGDRDRKALEAALSFQGAMMQDSWFQPMAYFDIGLLVMRDEGAVTGDTGGSRIESLGLVANLGIGVNLFISPYWFLGGRLGGTVHSHLSLERLERASDGDPERMVRYSGVRATQVGVNIALVTGFEF